MPGNRILVSFGREVKISCSVRRCWGGTLENPHSRGEIIDASSSLEGSDDHGGRGYEIVSKSVVEVALLILLVKHRMILRPRCLFEKRGRTRT